MRNDNEQAAVRHSPSRFEQLRRFLGAVSPGRRDFLKLTAAAGATFLGGCLNDDDDPQQ
jgi:hypothetical protein